ncbi:hypothetical protein IFM89_006975 [Coptis chinensis]|uniref:Uncharacterized protein n=1 Tax=Coptis chinensis TaxID=261450 RepID=A0A835LHS3_9MAGN|nr:hypothetical protein IFM89_006975 [Coptis chinensis]
MGPLKASATEQESILALRDQVFRIWGLLQSSEDFDPSMLQPIIQGTGAQVTENILCEEGFDAFYKLEDVVAIDINVPKQVVQRKQRLPATEASKTIPVEFSGGARGSTFVDTGEGISKLGRVEAGKSRIFEIMQNNKAIILILTCMTTETIRSPVLNGNQNASL